jgi:uncharacterized OsmC-like protein
MDMLTTLKAVARYTGTSLQIQTESRGLKLLFDEPPELGGTDKGPNPVEGILAALGACQSIVAVSFARKFNIDLKDFRVELEGDLDPDGFMDKAPVPIGLQKLRYTMFFQTDAPKDKVDAFVEYIETHCPVGATLNDGTELVRAGVVIE